MGLSKTGGVIIADVCSIFAARITSQVPLRVAGFFIGILAVVFFASATITMKINIPLLVISVWAGVMLHLQILQEENHMKKMFGEEYSVYVRHTFRYLGKNSNW